MHLPRQTVSTVCYLSVEKALHGSSVRHKRCRRRRFSLSRLSAIPVAVARLLAVCGKSLPWPFSTNANPEKAEVFRGSLPPHPAADHFIHGLLRKPPAQAGGSSGQSPGSRPGLPRTSSISEPKQCAVPNRIALHGPCTRMRANDSPLGQLPKTPRVFGGADRRILRRQTISTVC